MGQWSSVRYPGNHEPGLRITMFCSRCGLSLPPLPYSFLLDPVVGRVNDTLLVCHTDQDIYRVTHLTEMR